MNQVQYRRIRNFPPQLDPLLLCHANRTAQPTAASPFAYVLVSGFSCRSFSTTGYLVWRSLSPSCSGCCLWDSADGRTWLRRSACSCKFVWIPLNYSSDFLLVFYVVVPSYFFRQQKSCRLCMELDGFYCQTRPRGSYPPSSINRLSQLYLFLARAAYVAFKNHLTVITYWTCDRSRYTWSWE